MSTITLSSKYQVVIPASVRKTFSCSPGTKFQIVVYGDRLELIRVREMKEMRGFLKGISTEVLREDEERL